MLGAILGLALLAADPAGPDPADLIGELGSPRYRQRESAEAALTKLGRVAMPSLRAALGSKDPEVRLRASAILARIEGSLLVEATPIAFDFDQIPLAEAVRAINLRSGLTLQLLPEGDAAHASTRLTLRSAEPLPFWRGVDALCRAGGIHYDFGTPAHPGRRDRVFPLYPGPASTSELVWDSGPFRTHLSSVHYQSEIYLSKPRPASVQEPTPRGTTSRQFYLELMTAAEPRLSITRDGDPRVIEALDDQGASLLAPVSRTTVIRSSGYRGINPEPVVRFRVDLAYPDHPARKISRLRGVVPVIVSTRKPDPLRVELEGGIGQSHRNADVELTLLEVRPGRDGLPPAIELTVKSLGGEGGRAVDAITARLESPVEQLEVLDAQGKVLPWFPAGTFFNGEETRLTLSLAPQGRPARPSQPSTIIYHGMTRIPNEIPFEFRDVPIP